MTTATALRAVDDLLETYSQLRVSRSLADSASDVRLAPKATAIEAIFSVDPVEFRWREDSSSDVSNTVIADFSDADGRTHDGGRAPGNRRLLELVATLKAMPEDRDEQWWQEFQDFIRSNRPTFQPR